MKTHSSTQTNPLLPLSILFDAALPQHQPPSSEPSSSSTTASSPTTPWEHCCKRILEHMRHAEHRLVAVALCTLLPADVSTGAITGLLRRNADDKQQPQQLPSASTVTMGRRSGDDDRRGGDGGVARSTPPYFNATAEYDFSKERPMASANAYQQQQAATSIEMDMEVIRQDVLEDHVRHRLYRVIGAVLRDMELKCCGLLCAMSRVLPRHASGNAADALLSVLQQHAADVPVLPALLAPTTYNTSTTDAHRYDRATTGGNNGRDRNSGAPPIDDGASSAFEALAALGVFDSSRIAAAETKIVSSEAARDALGALPLDLRKRVLLGGAKGESRSTSSRPASPSATLSNRAHSSHPEIAPPRDLEKAKSQRSDHVAGTIATTVLAGASLSNSSADATTTAGLLNRPPPPRSTDDRRHFVEPTGGGSVSPRIPASHTTPAQSNSSNMPMALPTTSSSAELLSRLDGLRSERRLLQRRQPGGPNFRVPYYDVDNDTTAIDADGTPYDGGDNNNNGATDGKLGGEKDDVVASARSPRDDRRGQSPSATYDRGAATSGRPRPAGVVIVDPLGRDAAVPVRMFDPTAASPMPYPSSVNIVATPTTSLSPIRRVGAAQYHTLQTSNSATHSIGNSIFVYPTAQQHQQQQPLATTKPDENGADRRGPSPSMLSTARHPPRGGTAGGGSAVERYGYLAAGGSSHSATTTLLSSLKQPAQTPIGGRSAGLSAQDRYNNEHGGAGQPQPFDSGSSTPTSAPWSAANSYPGRFDASKVYAAAAVTTPRPTTELHLKGNGDAAAVGRGVVESFHSERVRGMAAQVRHLL